MEPSPWRVFYSYSHKDEEFRKKLGTYLAPLRQTKKIIEWHDRKIEPGANWETEISNELNSADLIVLLVSENFLDSDYCFGVEVEKAMARLKLEQVKVVPILLKPCLWDESKFSTLQFIPRDCKPITTWPSAEEAFMAISREIREIVSAPPTFRKSLASDSESLIATPTKNALELVHNQIKSYAKMYERIRQRMPASHERTKRMEEVFIKMQSLATASYPLLDELIKSPSPGERLAAIAILQVFADERYLPFLVKVIGSEKPFVGYQATKALKFASGALDPNLYPTILLVIKEAQQKLQVAGVGFDTDRFRTLREAEQEVQRYIEELRIYSLK